MVEATPPKIELRAIGKSFPLGHGQVRPVLDDIAFSAQPGEFVAVIGPSGCAKSTLFNIMAGLETASSGVVLVDGDVVTGQHEHFAYMP